MIETHCNPKHALSDKHQQLSVDDYIAMLNNVIFPQQQDINNNSLTQYRMAIDEIDNELIALIGKRIDIVKQIALYKKEKHLPILQIDRWQKVLDDSLQKTRQLNIDPRLIENIFQCIHESAIETQQNIVILNKEQHS